VVLRLKPDPEVRHIVGTAAGWPKVTAPEALAENLHVDTL